jgi:hypothetical protein
MDGSASGLCPTVGFRIGDIKYSGSTTSIGYLFNEFGM